MHLVPGESPSLQNLLQESVIISRVCQTGKVPGQRGARPARYKAREVPG